MVIRKRFVRARFLNELLPVQSVSVNEFSECTIRALGHPKHTEEVSFLMYDAAMTANIEATGQKQRSKSGAKPDGAVHEEKADHSSGNFTGFCPERLNQQNQPSGKQAKKEGRPKLLKYPGAKTRRFSW
jgi:hypothetical protein